MNGWPQLCIFRHFEDQKDAQHFAGDHHLKKNMKNIKDLNCQLGTPNLRRYSKHEFLLDSFGSIIFSHSQNNAIAFSNFHPAQVSIINESCDFKFQVFNWSWIWPLQGPGGRNYRRSTKVSELFPFQTSFPVWASTCWMFGILTQRPTCEKT